MASDREKIIFLGVLKMEKEKYVVPSVTCIVFSKDDAIRTSNVPFETGIEWDGNWTTVLFDE